MYITAENEREHCNKFWAGEPSGALIWSIMGPGLTELSRRHGFDSYQQLCASKLGCTRYAGPCIPFKSVNPNLQVVERNDNGLIVREYRSSHGILSETSFDGQIIDHKVKSIDDLKIFKLMLQDTEIQENFDFYRLSKATCDRQIPVVVTTDTPSAVQQFLQYETGVANFWFLAEDHPSALEECIEVHQSLMTEKYKLMQQVESDGFYQGENTSTAMISPQYYQKYGIPQMRQFADAAHAVGKRAIVHMCGHLHDLMPLIRETGMDGIHALTPPPVGNTTFEYAYSIMPSNTSILGRFGSLEWIGKSKAEIKENLRRVLAHNIYMEHPFILLVSTDAADFAIEDLYNTRDAIEEYEREGNGK